MSNRAKNKGKPKRKEDTEIETRELEETKKRLEEERKKREVSVLKRLDEERRLPKKYESQDLKRREEEARRKAEEEARKVEQELRKKAEEEARRKAEEEARKKTKELELKKRAEEEARKKMEAKMEEERKRKEEMEKKKEAEKLQKKKQEEEEKRRRDEEEKKRREEEKLQTEVEIVKQRITEHRTLQLEDLLGEYSDEEEKINNTKEQYSSSDSTTGEMRSHREANSRGHLDESVDNQLDRIQYSIPLKKYGKKDGFYLFGTRIMKTQLNNGSVVVTVGNATMTISDFVAKFEKVESTKLRGLSGAQTVCSMLSQIPVNQINLQ